MVPSEGTWKSAQVEVSSASRDNAESSESQLISVASTLPTA